MALAAGCGSSSTEPAPPAAPTPGDTGSSVKEEPPAEVKAADPQLLFAAAAQGHSEELAKLLTTGTDVNSTDPDGRTALMLAAFDGHEACVRILLEQEARVDLRDVNERTALMFAASGPFAATVKQLIDAGAEVDAADGVEAWTPLMFAAGEGQLEVVQVLLEAGAKTDLVDTDGDTARDFALRNRHTEVAQLLAGG